MAEESRALVRRSALEVDDREVDRWARGLLKHAQEGTGLFPREMTPAQASQLARLALAYGLDPFAEELILYQGRPYLTFRGAKRIALEHPQFDGIEEPRPATDEERNAFRCAEDEHLWVVRVWRKDRRFPFVGYGRARAGEQLRGGRGEEHPVARTHPQEMAQARAKRRALLDAFSLPAPIAPAGVEQEELGPVLEADALPVNPITPQQVRAIHTVVHKLGWEEKRYRSLLDAAFGVASSKELTQGQAAAFLEELAAERQATPEELARYGRGLKAAAELGIDLAAYEVAQAISQGELGAKAADLERAIRQAVDRRRGGQPTPHGGLV